MIGDTIKVVVTVTDKRDEKRVMKLRTAAYGLVRDKTSGA